MSLKVILDDLTEIQLFGYQQSLTTIRRVRSKHLANAIVSEIIERFAVIFEKFGFKIRK